MDQALAELSDLPEKVLALGRNGSLPPAAEMGLMKTVAAILRQVQQARPD